MKSQKVLRTLSKILCIGIIFLVNSCDFFPQELEPDNTIQNASTVSLQTPTLLLSSPVSITSTPVATQTLQSTLDNQFIHEYISSLSETNGGCQYPCFWGITPGETTWSEVQTAFEPISQDRDGLIYNQEGTWFEIYLIDTGYQIGIDTTLNFRVQGDVVTEIIFQREYPINDLLSEFGTPEDVRLLYYEHPGNSVPGFWLLVAYPSKGILIQYLDEYGADYQNENGSIYVEVCPEYLNGIISSVLLWDPTQENAYENFIQRMEGDFHTEFEEISGNSNLDNDTFYHEFLDSQSGRCLLRLVYPE